MAELEIKILDNRYETNYPTVGQCIDIKRLELSLSGNRMSNLISSNLMEDTEIALDIKAIAILSILFPKLKEDLKTDSLLDLRYDDWMEILNVFTEKVFPWYTDWKNSLRKIDTKKILEDDSDSRTESKGDN